MEIKQAGTQYFGKESDKPAKLLKRSQLILKQ
jgi:hypothetical protein